MRHASSVRSLVNLAARVTDEPPPACGVRVEMHGTRGRKQDRYVASLVARNGSAHAVTSAPIVALIRHWLARGVREAGAMSCVGLLRLTDLAPELGGQDVVLVRE